MASEWDQFVAAHPVPVSPFIPSGPVATENEPEPCAQCGEEIPGEHLQAWADCPCEQGDGANPKTFCSPQCWEAGHAYEVITYMDATGVSQIDNQGCPGVQPPA